MDHNIQKKIAVINDITGFGRCSTVVSLPIISHMRIQCCPVPTSILSNHTGFDSFYFDDYTDRLNDYINEWKKLDLKFNGILSGFLGSSKQISIVKDFISNFSNEGTVVIIDPVMGDNGRTYSTYTAEMCDEMKDLVKHADIITPNLTEACILTDTKYDPDNFTHNDICDLAIKLSDCGATKIVISGISTPCYIENVVYEKGKVPVIVKQKRVGHERSGTGDIFASIIAADSIHGTDFTASVKKASHFIKECIRVTEANNIARTDGVCFEEILYTLK